MLTEAGIVIGTGAAFALTRMMGNLLYQTGATDPATFLASALLFTATALAASYGPAHYAAEIDPAALPFAKSEA